VQLTKEYKGEIYTTSHIESTVLELAVLLAQGARLTAAVNQKVIATTLL
jgi:hypothetical protein